VEKYLTAEEVRVNLRISEPTLWRWRREGRLRAFKLAGWGVRFREADVLAVLKEEAVPA